MRPLANHDAVTPRTGFTLVELLTVIAIIAVLVTLVASATFQVIGVQQQRTTEMTIMKVADALDQEWQAVLDQAKTESIPPNITTMAGGDPRRARVIYIKFRLATEFPLTFSEAVNAPQGLYARKSYVDALGTWTPPSSPNYPNYTNPAGNNYFAESGACLYMSLKQNRRGMNTTIDNLLTAQEVGTITIINNNNQPMTFPTIMDAWGHPVVFFRSPTSNQELNIVDPSITPGNTYPLATAQSAITPTDGLYSSPGRDPQDPDATLADLNWIYKPGTSNPSQAYQNFTSTCHPLLSPPPYITVTGLPSPSPPSKRFFGAFKLIPVVASFGATYGHQRTYAGLGDQFMTPDGHGDAGNIYSYRLRLGARGD
jgi:prepilin-type N-terminal cleavage/methylation domain-containing protein